MNNTVNFFNCLLLEGKKKIKVGILIDSFQIYAWIHSVLNQILSSDFAEVCLVVKNDTKTQPLSFLDRMKINREYLLYNFYTKFEANRYKLANDVFKIKDSKELLKNIPQIDVNPKQTKFSDYIGDEDIEKIQKYDIDVFFRLGFRILRGKILETAKYGIWSYHHADNNVNRGGPPGFWEVFEKQPVTGSILQILSEDLDSGKTLYKSFSSTNTISVKQNRNNYYWKSVPFFCRKLKELYDLGGEEFFQKVEKENSDLSFYDKRLYTRPKNSEFLKLFLPKITNSLKYKFYNNLFFRQWILLFDFQDNISTSLWRFQKIIPPKDKFWADPFIVYKDQKYHIFLEEFIFKTKKAHISLMQINENGEFSKPKKILEKSYHLSYPFIFNYKNDFFMIPETISNHSIEIYKAVEFPNKWEFEKEIMTDIDAVDATMFEHAGKWWLFTNLRENKNASSHDELFLFYSNDPLSDNWIPHPQNPIISDVRRARPAGKLFHFKDKIYRPAQDCSKYYGYGLTFNQITKINENEYEEKVIDYVHPEWDKNIQGTHTFCHEKRLTMVDASIKRRR